MAQSLLKYPVRNRFPLSAFSAIVGFLSLFATSLFAQLEDPRLDVVSGHYTGTSFDSLTFINDTVGARIFYNSGYFGGNSIIANVEGGYIWDGHEVFDRSAFSGSNAVTRFVSDPSVTGQYDYHATMVGHVLAGAGLTQDRTDLSIAGAGIAPFAELWSGAIATSFSSSDIGSFDTTTASTLTPYKTFFRGTLSDPRKADVVNSSWGGDDPNSSAMLTVDALARENSTVAFVVAAGNSGTSSVTAPASLYNNIAVGSLGGTNFLTPSEFSSRGPADFVIRNANPALDQTITGVRAAVDIAAPGEQMALAAYLGSTGSLAGQPITQDSEGQPYTPATAPTDQYFTNLDGTSFASPIVAGGVGLLKDVAKSSFYAPLLGANALDTRVIKSVLMAGSRETVGWDNGQHNLDGVIVTTQSLDYATGAGALDLTGAAEIYLLSSTRDVAGLGGGTITSSGWDYGSAALHGSNDYIFDSSFAANIELTISLNWFSGSTIGVDDLGQDLSFADLNLSLWLVVGGVLTEEVAESSSLYNNSEFLRLTLSESGLYALRVTFQGLIYDLTPGGVTSEDYGLAWQAVPEPGTIALLVCALVLLFLRKRQARA